MSRYRIRKVDDYYFMWCVYIDGELYARCSSWLAAMYEIRCLTRPRGQWARHLGENDE